MPWHRAWHRCVICIWSIHAEDASSAVSLISESVGCFCKELGQILSRCSLWWIAPLLRHSHQRSPFSGKKGRGGNHGGSSMLLCASDKGLVTGWMTGLANIDDRWVMEAFFSSRKGEKQLIEPALPKHRTYKQRIPSLDFSPALTAGRDRSSGRIQRKTDQSLASNAEVFAPRQQSKGTSLQDHALAAQTGKSSRRSPRLVQNFGLHRINAHSELGMLTRIAAKMAAYNIGVMLNHTSGRPRGAMATLIC